MSLKLLFGIFNSRYVGGGSYILFKFAEYLAKRGHEVHIYCTNWPAAYEDDSIFKNLDIDINVENKDLPTYSNISQTNKMKDLFKQMYSNAHSANRIENFLKHNKVDYIISHPEEQSFKLAKLSKKYGTKFCMFAYEGPIWIKETSQNKKDLIKRYINYIIRWRFVKKALLNSDIIVAISKLAKADCERWIAREIDGIVHPGVDSDYVDKIPNQEERYQIIYVGRLSKNKNVGDVIKALAKISNHLKFVIIGHGSEKPKLEKLAKELNVNCEFKGILSDYEKWVEIKKSMFMVTASSLEGSADVPSEALYCEKPCLATGIPIMRSDYGDIIEYFREHDIDDLAKKIKFLIENPEYRRKRGEEGKRFVEKNYTLKVSATKLEEILMECNGMKINFKGDTR